MDEGCGRRASASCESAKMWAQPPSRAGNENDRGNDGDVDERVLDEGYQGRRAQSAGVRVCGEQHERGRERGERAAGAEHLEPAEDGAHSNELKRDVRHRRHDTGQRDGDLQPAIAVAVAHEVGGRDVTATACDAPESGQHDQGDRICDGRVRDGEEPQRTDAVDERRHRDKRVRGVEIAAQ